MNKISLPQPNNHFIYPNKQKNIINNNTNHIKYLMFNSSSYIFNNKNNLDINEDKHDFNNQMNQNGANLKEINLNQIKKIPISNSLNEKYSIGYIPISSRERNNLKNNFAFYNNDINKTIIHRNAVNNLTDNSNINKYTIVEENKDVFKNNKILYKSQAQNNYSVTKKAALPFFQKLNPVNNVIERNQSQYYETPKNILLSQKNNFNLNEQPSRKTKYKKFFNENILKLGINEINKIIEKSGYISYNNIHKKSNVNNIKINSRDCITPFLNNRSVKKFGKYNFQQPLNITKENNINIDTDINNNIDTELKNKLNYNYQIEIAPIMKTTPNQNSVFLDNPKILNFSTNIGNEILNNKNKDLKNGKILEREKNEIKKKDTIPTTEMQSIDNFDYNHKKPFYLNRFTNYENRKLKNHLFIDQLKRAQKPYKRNLNMNNTELLPDNKENINSNLNNKDSFLEDDASLNMNFEQKRIEYNKKRKQKKHNQNEKLKYCSFENNNFINKRIKMEMNMINNNSLAMKANCPLNNSMKQDEMGNNLNTEVFNYRVKNNQVISLLKKPQEEIDKLKGEINKPKNKINKKNCNEVNNEIKSKNNKEKKIIRIKYNTLKQNVKNKDKNNNLSINLNISIPENKILSPKLVKKTNVQNNDNNANQEKFLKGSSILNDSQNIFSQKSQTTLNTSKNLLRHTPNSYKLIFPNVEKISEEKGNKYIYSLYYSIKNNNNNNKNIKVSAICFDPENASFKLKQIENKNDFNKNFYESVNKTNNTIKNIYFSKNDDFYIITGGKCNKFYKYKFMENKLEQKCDLKYNHSHGGIICYKGQIICLSGNYNKKVEVFSENDDIWIDLPEMNIERSYFSSCIIKDRYLFVFFGFNYPNKIYLDSIEYFDILKHNLNMLNKNCQKYNDISWRYLNYNYFNSNPNNKTINLIGALAINYHNEKIIFLGGKNCLTKENYNGYYQFILDEEDMKGDEVNSYFERIMCKDISGKNCFINNDYKYIEDLNRNNIMKEHACVAFDNNFGAHLIKLSTMNHEVFHFNK